MRQAAVSRHRHLRLVTGCARQAGDPAVPGRGITPIGRGRSNSRARRSRRPTGRNRSRWCLRDPAGCSWGRRTGTKAPTAAFAGVILHRPGMQVAPRFPSSAPRSFYRSRGTKNRTTACRCLLKGVSGFRPVREAATRNRYGYMPINFLIPPLPACQPPCRHAWVRFRFRWEPSLETVRWAPGAGGAHPPASWRTRLTMRARSTLTIGL